MSEIEEWVQEQLGKGVTHEQIKQSLIENGYDPNIVDEVLALQNPPTPDVSGSYGTTSRGLHPAFEHRHYLFRRKVLKLFGGAFHIYDENGKLLFYSKQKAFKLKEDFRIYSDESQSEELLTIKTPQIFDISATYNVYDKTTGEPVGAIKRKGLKSFIKDEWIFLSRDGQEIGKLTERDMTSAILCRLFRFIPQTYIITSSGGKGVAEIKRHFNLFVLKYTMRITEPEPSIDRRLLIAAGILLMGIEGRQ